MRWRPLLDVLPKSPPIAGAEQSARWRTGWRACLTRPFLQFLEGGWPFDRRLVFSEKAAFLYEPLALLFADRPGPCHGRRDQALCHDFWVALGVEHRDQGFAPASSVIAAAVSKEGFRRNVSAAALTAFWSRGVNARKAC
jgi:hypothetical protein